MDISVELNLKILDWLMRIGKEIPPYDENEKVFDDAEEFESHTDTFNLINQQKNVCFKV